MKFFETKKGYQPTNIVHPKYQLCCGCHVTTGANIIATLFVIHGLLVIYGGISSSSIYRLAYGLFEIIICSSVFSKPTLKTNYMHLFCWLIIKITFNAFALVTLFLYTPMGNPYFSSWISHECAFADNVPYCMDHIYSFLPAFYMIIIATEALFCSIVYRAYTYFEEEMEVYIPL